jgi:hypothetical protein
MKVCPSCSVEKPLTSYALRGKNRPGERQYSCDECRLTDLRNHKMKISNLVKRWKLIKGCSLCDFKADHSCQLDIDHILPKRAGHKDRQAINTGWSRVRLKAELSKCQVLCANCHRLKTFQDGTMFQTYEVRKQRTCE